MIAYPIFFIASEIKGITRFAGWFTELVLDCYNTYSPSGLQLFTTMPQKNNSWLSNVYKIQFIKLINE